MPWDFCQGHGFLAFSRYLPRPRVAKEGEHLTITLGETTAEDCGVVLRYPLVFSHDPILADLRVTFSKKCTFNTVAKNPPAWSW